MSANIFDNPAAHTLLEGSLDWTRDPVGHEVASILRSRQPGTDNTSARLEELAAQGSHISALFLGFDYRDGTGVVADQGRAEEWFRRAAESGDGYARHVLARFLTSNKRYQEAVAVYRAALSAGHLESGCFLGRMLLYGRGVPVDRRGGLAALSFAARRGNAPASVLLGRHLIRTRWYNPISLVRGGWLYWFGRAGVIDGLTGTGTQRRDSLVSAAKGLATPAWFCLCLWLGDVAGLSIWGCLLVFGVMWGAAWVALRLARGTCAGPNNQNAPAEPTIPPALQS